jgi:nickel-type superoxide dismutase maturation protease
VVAAASAVAIVATRVVHRVVVEGDSMRPTLDPGDKLLILRLPLRPARPGSLVALHDPREPAARALVKRVSGLGIDGVEVRGDNPVASTDSRSFGPVAPKLVIGPVLYRYFPPERAGRVR